MPWTQVRRPAPQRRGYSQVQPNRAGFSQVPNVPDRLNPAAIAYTLMRLRQHGVPVGQGEDPTLLWRNLTAQNAAQRAVSPQAPQDLTPRISGSVQMPWNPQGFTPRAPGPVQVPPWMRPQAVGNPIANALSFPGGFNPYAG